MELNFSLQYFPECFRYAAMVNYAKNNFSQITSAEIDIETFEEA